MNNLAGQYSLKRLLVEYPEMFLNEVVYERAMNIIRKYDGLDAKYTLKKLKSFKKA